MPPRGGTTAACLLTAFITAMLGLIILPPPACAFTASGYVEDATTGERLIGAQVFDPDHDIGTTTNSYGFFSLTLPTADSDTMSLAVSYIGYQNWRQVLRGSHDQHLRIGLTPQPIEMTGVQVVAERQETIEDRTRMSVIEIPIARLRAVPALLGEVDIIKAIQLLPGVQSGMEGSSGLYVRGGGPRIRTSFSLTAPPSTMCRTSLASTRCSTPTR